KFGPRGKGLSGGRQIPQNGTFDVEDLALGIIRFEGGLTINLEVSWALHNRANKQWCEVYGELGGGEWGDHPGLFHEIQDAPATSTPELPPNDAWKNIMQHFVDSILHDTTPDPDVYQGIAVMKMLDGLYQSAASGHEVVID